MFKVKFYCTLTNICTRMGMYTMAHKFFDKACESTRQMLTRLEKD